MQFSKILIALACTSSCLAMADPATGGEMLAEMESSAATLQQLAQEPTQFNAGFCSYAMREAAFTEKAQGNDGDALNLASAAVIFEKMATPEYMEKSQPFYKNSGMSLQGAVNLCYGSYQDFRQAIPMTAIPEITQEAKKLLGASPN